MHQIHRAAKASLLLLIVTLTACASDRQAMRLEDNLFAYDQVIRRGDFYRAVNFIHPDDRPSEQQLQFTLSRLDHIQVTGYRSMGQQIVSPGIAEQYAELRIANKHTLVERVVRDRQRWRFDAERDRWWLTSGLPDISR